MNIKFNIDLMESLNKLSDSDSIQDYESLWGKFLKHIGEQPVTAGKLYDLASDKFYNESEYQNALNFRDLFIKKWGKLTQTTLLEDLVDLVDQFSREKISADQVIKTLENIVFIEKYEQNHK
mgnify:FL=1|tara:strand:+ start:166 stop:531 length:366 start_codon:yes stop_codon:yes gene_type:complete